MPTPSRQPRNTGNANLNLTYERTLGSLGGIRAEGSAEVGLEGVLNLKGNRLSGGVDFAERTASLNTGIGVGKKLSGSLEGSVKLRENGSIESLGGGISGNVFGFGGGLSADNKGNAAISAEAFGGKVEVARDSSGAVTVQVCYGVGIAEFCTTFSRDNGDPQNSGSLRLGAGVKPSTGSTRPRRPSAPTDSPKRPGSRVRRESPKPERPKPERQPKPPEDKQPNLVRDSKKKPQADIRKKPQVDLRKKPSIDLTKPKADIRRKPVKPPRPPKPKAPSPRPINLKKPVPTPVPKPTPIPRPKPTPKLPKIPRPVPVPTPKPVPVPRPNPWSRTEPDKPRTPPVIPPPVPPNTPIPPPDPSDTSTCSLVYTVKTTIKDLVDWGSYKFGDVIETTVNGSGTSFESIRTQNHWNLTEPVYNWEKNSTFNFTVNLPYYGTDGFTYVEPTTLERCYISYVYGSDGDGRYGICAIQAEGSQVAISDYISRRYQSVHKITSDSVYGKEYKTYDYAISIIESSCSNPNLKPKKGGDTAGFQPPRLPNQPTKVKPMNCCKKVDEIYKYLGIAKLKKEKFKVAKAFLVPGGTGTEDCEDYYQLNQALFRMLANGLIINPVSKPLGSEWKSVNATAWAGQVYEMVAEAMSNGDSSQKYEISMMMQITQLLSIIAEQTRKIEFLSEVLGVEPGLDTEEVPACFTIYEGHKGFDKTQPKKIDTAKAKTDDEVEAILGKMLKPSKIPITKWVFKPESKSIVRLLRDE
ncbi:hypothetical protein [Microcoleus sp. EPA2]|uniref:hypothetical protein n=1 Tax=Microcoleus sp. EPA2 TaxID=2841654 RepID=UPI00312B8B36